MRMRKRAELALLAVGILAVMAAAAYGYNSVYSLKFIDTPTGSAMAGKSFRVNDIPVRPLSAVSERITYAVASPYRVSLGKLPKGAQIIGVFVAVSTAFNAGTTNVLVVGTITVPEQIVASADVTESAAATTVVCHNGVTPLAADTEYFARFTQTGGAATTGVARVTILYAIP